MQGDGDNQITRGQQPVSCLCQPPGHEGAIFSFVTMFEAQDEGFAGPVINKHRATAVIGGAFVQTRAAENSIADCLDRQTTERTGGVIDKVEGRPTIWTEAGGGNGVSGAGQTARRKTEVQEVMKKACQKRHETVCLSGQYQA